MLLKLVGLFSIPKIASEPMDSGYREEDFYK